MFERSLLFDLADELAKKIYKITLTFSYIHQNSIGNQLRRACLSIVLNIVEGGAKTSIKERINYKRISFGSLKETKYLVYFAHELRLVKDDEYKELMEKINRLAAVLYGLLRKS